MDYLLVKLLPYAIGAFVIGLFFGWFACTPSDDEQA